MDAITVAAITVAAIVSGAIDVRELGNILMDAVDRAHRRRIDQFFQF
jgi:hypothetical protein